MYCVVHDFLELVCNLVGVYVLNDFQPDLPDLEDRLFLLTVKAFDEFLVFLRVFVLIQEFNETAQYERNAWRVAAFVVDHIEFLDDCLIRRLYELILALRYLHLLFVVKQRHYHRVDLVVFRAIFCRYLLKILSNVFNGDSGLLIAEHKRLQFLLNMGRHVFRWRYKQRLEHRFKVFDSLIGTVFVASLLLIRTQRLFA